MQVRSPHSDDEPIGPVNIAALRGRGDFLRKRERQLSAFSLVELLAVIGVIAILVAVMLPAIQSVRESARVTHCQNSVRELTTALITYHDTNGRFPSGGWGHAWVGVPERGVGKRQPGGWAYSILPLLDEASLHQLGAGASGAEATALYSSRLQTSVPLFVCPSRRSCSSWPLSDKYSWVKEPRPFGSPTKVGRADYAINGGTSHVFSFGGPSDLQQGEDANFWFNSPNARMFKGISHLRNSVSVRAVTDGTSKTYLIGEKYVDTESYMSGSSEGDNESLYSGYCTDLHRFTGSMEQLKVNRSPLLPPLSDYVSPTEAPRGFIGFGSAHPAGFNMSHCDGSVRLVAFDVDPEMHFRSGHRRDDGVPINTLN